MKPPRYPVARGSRWESQVVVLAVSQAAGQRVVLFISAPERAAVWLTPARTAGRNKRTWMASAAGSTASRPWLPPTPALPVSPDARHIVLRTSSN